MNFQLCRHAVNDPHKADLVTTQVCSPTLYEYLLKYSDLHLEFFWRTSVTCTPLRMVNIDPAFPIFFLYLPPSLTD